jgi:hypothetical protein
LTLLLPFHFVEILLKLAHLIGEEAKRVVKGEVFDIRFVVLGLVTEFIELGKKRFDFHPG